MTDRNRSLLEKFRPYHSPLHDEPATEIVFNPFEERIGAECLRRGWLFRRLRLFGRVEAVLEWNAGGTIEKVRIGEHTVSSLCPFWYAPRFDFLVPLPDHRIVGRIEVRLTRVLPIALRAFRLILEQHTIYQEGQWSAPKRSPVGPTRAVTRSRMTDLRRGRMVR